ncbi:saccharopine dehydrogenase family protein [Saccharospirillum impatiens]|uniref:saccharopine dehydrogenase family protein n=1 Tax=Saccharospirillum impatiens TaxID=169438 RepID=UPI00041742AF|nr:saccharopine dehydrogenase NADP-binding domain-containing protein [Saccharospirillum impatiens]
MDDRDTPYVVVVLGGYGNFGKRISAALAKLAGIRLVIAGRHLAKAEVLCASLSAQQAVAQFQPVAIDISAADFVERIAACAPGLVIHTSGPFQGQDYRVPEACIALRCHYIDLADDRRFVCDITRLETQARQAGVLVVSGASSVPGLSSTVVDHFASRFTQISSIDSAIAPGNRAERGEATVGAILSYTGHKLPVWRAGRWQAIYGWMSPRKRDFGSIVGKRWLANVDVPDLELFARRYDGVKNVTFQAGLELGFLHWGMVAMAWCSKVGLVKDWSRWTKAIVAASRWFIDLGSATGGMQVTVTGRDASNKPLAIQWRLAVEHGSGPYIPTLSALILAKKLIAGSLSECGAKPCLGLYSLAEFKAEAAPWGLKYECVVNGEVVDEPLLFA